LFSDLDKLNIKKILNDKETDNQTDLLLNKKVYKKIKIKELFYQILEYAL